MEKAIEIKLIPLTVIHVAVQNIPTPLPLNVSKRSVNDRIELRSAAKHPVLPNYYALFVHINNYCPFALIAPLKGGAEFFHFRPCEKIVRANFSNPD